MWFKYIIIVNIKVIVNVIVKVANLIRPLSHSLPH